MSDIDVSQDAGGPPPATGASQRDESVLPADLLAAIEAILMVAERPIEPRLLAQLVEVSMEAVESACASLAQEYEAAGRGFVIARVAGGYRFQSHSAQAAYVERFVLEGQVSKLSAAALETMAIVAYKQPISRAQVAAIRGVSVDAVMRTLDQRGYIDEVARDGGPGQAVLYGTTPLFLERLGLDSIADLPELGDFVPEADIVEALEHGLRFTDVPESLETASTSTSTPDGVAGVEATELVEAPLSEVSADEEVTIDLRDPDNVTRSVGTSPRDSEE